MGIFASSVPAGVSKPTVEPIFPLKVGGGAQVLLSLPSADDTGKINLGLWQDARVKDILISDHEGLFKTIPGTDNALVPSGAIPMQNARVVQSLLDATEDFTDVLWIKQFGSIVSSTEIAPDGSATAAKFTFSAQYGNLRQDDLITQTGCDGTYAIWIKLVDGNSNLRLRGSTAGSVYSNPITVTTEWQRFSYVNTHDGTNNIGLVVQDLNAAGQGSILVWHPSFEDSTGQSNQSPSEYQTRDTSSATYGFAYYANENGNTVDGGGVVTEAIGSLLSPAPTIVHYPASENYFLNSDAPVTQNIDFTALGTGDYTLSVHGAGTVTSADVGATGTGHGAASDGTDITFNLTVAGTVSFTVAGGPPDYVQVEKKAFSTSPIVTAATSVTRDACRIRHPFAGYFNQNAGVCVVDVTFNCDQAEFAGSQHGLVSITEAQGLLYLHNVGGRPSSYDGTSLVQVDPSFIADSKSRIVARWATDGELQTGFKDIDAAGAWVWTATPANYDGAFAAGTGWINLAFANDFIVTYNAIYMYDREMSTDLIEALAE